MNEANGNATYEKGTYFEVFTINEFVQDRQVKNAWMKIGVAFPNQDGSFNIKLRALPITDLKTGTANLHMRLPRPKEDKEDYENGQATSSDTYNHNNADTQEYDDSDYIYDPSDPRKGDL